MRIRSFQEVDRASVIELWKLCKLTRPWNDPDRDISRKLAFQRELFLVGEIDGKVMASAMAGYDGHRGSVFYLAVAPEFQGRGFGAQIMRSVEDELRDKGCPKLNIAVRSSNEAVMQFYSHLGYNVDDVITLGKRLILDE